jgi:peptidoglycan/LPS O-acetylase OafA/YrhL
MHPKYRPDIDGLRAIAVFAVIGFHAFPSNLVGGFVGVDIFFVISGFLISTIIFGDLERDAFSIVQFYNRRIRRIFPALILVMAASLVFGWFVLIPDEYLRLGKQLIASALFAQNFVLWKQVGYFDTSAHAKPLLHLWSLAVEEQFYIFWPLLLAWGWKRKLSFPIIAGIVAAVSFSANICAANIDPSADYYLPVSRFWELMIGGILAYLSLHRPDVMRQHENLQALTGMVLIVLSIFLIDNERSFPGWWALMPTLGTALVISAGPAAYVNKRLLSNGLLVWPGLISYPLYLWHWPLLSFAYIVNPHLSRSGIVLLIVCATGLAILTYRFVELPIRTQRQTPRVPFYLAGALCVLPVCGILVVSGVWGPRLDLKQLTLKDEWDFLKAQPAKYDENATGVYRFHPEREQTTVFIGDSEIAQYAQRIAAVQRNEKLNGAIFAVGGGCIPIKDVYTDERRRRNCQKILADGLARARNKDVSTVVIGGDWSWYLLSDGYYFGSGRDRIALDSQSGRAKAFSDLEELLESFRKQHKKVFFLLGTPMSEGFNPHTHIPRLTTFEPLQAHPYITLDYEQQHLRRSLLQVAANAGADVVDPFPVLCDAKKCRWVSDDGVPIFKDDTHFNPAWALANAVFIDKTVEPFRGGNVAKVGN